MGAAVANLDSCVPRTIDDLAEAEIATLVSAYGHSYGSDASSLAYAVAGGSQKEGVREELEAVRAAWAKLQFAWRRLRPSAREQLIALVANNFSSLDLGVEFDPDTIDLSKAVEQLQLEAFGKTSAGRDETDPGFPALAHAAYSIWRQRGGEPELGRITNRKNPLPLYEFVGSVFRHFATADLQSSYKEDGARIAREQAGRILTKIGREALERPFKAPRLPD